MPTARHHEVLNLAPHNATLITSPSYLCFQLYSNWTLLNVWKPQFTRSWSSHCKLIFNDMFALGFTATDKNSFLLKQILTKSINLRRYWWEENTTLSEGAGHSHAVVLLNRQRPTPSILGFRGIPATSYLLWCGLDQPLKLAVMDRDEKNPTVLALIVQGQRGKELPEQNTHKDVCPRQRQIQDKVLIRSGVKHPWGKAGTSSTEDLSHSTPQVKQSKKPPKAPSLPSQKLQIKLADAKCAVQTRNHLHTSEVMIRPTGPAPRSWQAAPAAALFLHISTSLNPFTQPASTHFPWLSSTAMKKINVKLQTALLIFLSLLRTCPPLWSSQWACFDCWPNHLNRNLKAQVADAQCVRALWANKMGSVQTL